MKDISSKLKKATCLFLSLVLCLGLVPSEVFAVELNNGEELIQEESVESNEYQAGETYDYASKAAIQYSWDLGADDYGDSMCYYLDGANNKVWVSSGIIAGDEGLPTVIKVKTDNYGHFTLYWLYEVTTGVGLQLSNTVMYQDPQYLNRETQQSGTFETLGGQFFYWPAMPTWYDGTIEYYELPKEEVAKISDVDLRNTIMEQGNQIPIKYNYKNPIHLTGTTSLYNATKIAMNRQTSYGPAWTTWEVYTISDTTDGTEHVYDNFPGGDSVLNGYKYNFKDRAGPSILTMWMSSQDEVKAATGTHLGNFVKGGENYYAPRYVMDKEGAAVSYVSFPVDVNLSNSSIIKDKELGISCLYPAPDANPSTNAYVSRGLVNNAWQVEGKAEFQPGKLDKKNGYFTTKTINGKSVTFLDRNNKLSRSLLNLSAYIEQFFGASTKIETFYDNIGSKISEKAVKSTEILDRGLWKWYEERHTEVPDEYYPGPCTPAVIQSLPEADRQNYLDASLTWKILLLMSYAEITGYPGDITQDNIMSNYVKIGMSRNSKKNYNYWTMGKVVEYDSILTSNPTVSIERDIVVSDAQKNDILGDEAYFGTNLWKLKDDAKNKLNSILGISEEQYKKLNTTNSKDGKTSDGTRLNELSKDEFLALFEPVNPKEGLTPDEVYVLQSSTYMDMKVSGLAEDVDIFSIRPSSYNSTFGLAFNVGFNDKEITEPKTRLEYARENSNFISNAAAHFGFPSAINDNNDGHRVTTYPSVLVEKSQTNKGSILYKGNPFTPLDYKKDKEETYTWFEPWAGYNTSSNEAGQIITGWSDNDKYVNSLTGPESDNENKVNNIKTYRAFYKLKKEEIKDKKTLDINVFLADMRTGFTRADVAQYSLDRTPEVSNEIIGMVYDAYIFSKDEIIKALKNDKNSASNASEIESLILNTQMDLMKASGVEKQNEAKLKFIERFHNLVPQKILTEVIGTNFQWMFKYTTKKAADGKDEQVLIFNPNDNIDPKNDGITLHYSINPLPADEQYNLRITYLTIYGKSREGGGDWKEIYRSESGEIEDIVKNKKGIVDLTAMGIILNTNMDYVVCIGQGFDSFNEEFKENPDVDKDPNSLYMYGYVEGIGNAKDSKIYPDYSFTNGNISNRRNPQKWQSGEQRSASGKPSDATIKNWNESQGINNDDHQNQILSGIYYDKLISQGQGKTDSEGNQYIDGVYSFGVHDDWSSYPEDQDAKNPNTILPLPIDMIDPEDLKIKYRFTNATDFDNAITDVYLIDRDGNRVDLSQDCYDPAWLKDVDLGSSDPYYGTSSNPTQMGYTLVVKVERLETGKEHKDVGSQSQLSFYGNMFGNDYLQSSPLVLNYASSTGQVKNLKEQVTNSGGTLSKNGDYITYYLNNVYPTSGIDICGTFVFKHRDKNNQLSVADKNMLNNYKKGAASWGPLDFIVSNLQINPEKLYIPQDESYYPSWNSGEFYVNFNCDVEATYTDKNGNKPIINNDKLFTNFVLTLDAKNMNVAGTEFSQQYEVFRINNLKMTINSGSIHISGQAKINQRMEGMQSNIINNGSMITYRKDIQYRFTARINGGNAIYEGSSTHEKTSDQKVKLETIHNNNRDYAYLDINTTPDDSWDEYWCETPHTMNTWTVTFHWTKCPGELWDSHTVCSGDPSSCTTYTDCHPQGCFSWTGQKTFKETFKIEAYVKSQANGNRWEQISGSSPIEIRAGQTFQFRAKTIYETDRWDMPPEHPWGGCSYCSRSPGYSRPSATRQVRVRVRNPSGGQQWTYTTYMSGWDQNHDSPVFTVPEDTQNLTMTYDIDVRPFWGYREAGIEEPLCDRKLGINVKITNPLPIASGTQIID